MNKTQKMVCAPIATLIIIGSLIGGANAANMLINGSFENPGQSSRYVEHTGSGISGWTITEGSVDTLTSSYITPSDGNYSIDLDGSSAGTIAQTIATVIGQKYLFSIDVLGSLTGLESAVFDVTGLTSVFNETAISTNSSFLFKGSFTADSNLSTLSIASNNLNGDRHNGLLLDNASIVAVPEPSSALLLGFGTMGLVLCRRRIK